MAFLLCSRLFAVITASRARVRSTSVLTTEPPRIMSRCPVGRSRLGKPKCWRCSGSISATPRSARACSSPCARSSPTSPHCCASWRCRIGGRSPGARPSWPPPSRSRPAPALPAPLTTFVGRVRERAELGEAVKTHRQVTAVGPGGVGKTRLALAVAAEAAGDFADGVWFVDLVPITDPGRVGAAVAAAVGVGEQPGRSIDDAVLAALAERQALLVLDNCEQVRDGVAPFLERLLAACPRVRVLATSRARLVVPFERVFPVPPLSLAGGGGVGGGDPVHGPGGGGRLAAGSGGTRPGRRDLRTARRHGAGDRAGGGAVAHARAGRPHRRPLRPAPDPRRRTPRRRPAPVGAGGAGLEPRPAGAGGSGAAAAGVGVRRAVHRRGGRGGGRVRPAGAGRGRRCAGPPRRAEPARGDDVRGRHPVPGAGDHPPVRDRAAHRGRRAGRGALPAPGLVPGRARPSSWEAYARTGEPGSTRWPTTSGPP